MSDYDNKPKGQPRRVWPYILVAIGIVIGLALATSVAVILFFVPVRQVVVTATPAPIDAQAVRPLPTATYVPTAPPIPNGTVIADRVVAASVSPDGELLAYALDEGGLSRVILSDMRVRGNLGGDEILLYEGNNRYNDLVFNATGDRLLATINSELTSQGTALLFEIPSGRLLEQYPQISGAAFSPDGTQLALVGSRNGIRLIDVASNQLIAATSHEVYNVGEVAFNQRGQIALAIDNVLEIYNAQDLNGAAQVFTLPTSFIYDLAFHPDGRYLAVAGDGFVQVLDLDTDTRTDYRFDASRIHTVAFSRDGSWLAAGGGYSGVGTARLRAFRWDASDTIPPDPTFFEPVTLEGHSHIISDLIFTPDGYLLSASWDGGIRLWDVVTGHTLSTFYP